MTNILKSILFIALTGILLSSACKEASGHSTDEIVETGSDFVLAKIVDMGGEDGCGFVIIVAKGSEDQIYMPVELNDTYKLDGLRVKIKFHTSRIKQEGCLQAQPIVIDQIEKV